ncbi:class IIb bacteriocin, lactobin A/cerein 7B family [Bradyrhizobium sp. CCBAU 53421]|uniref:class IIb bacteriocin, lactobin A/cerein 7B family n=1 Tax=Bradyrhizobium sp. CCBAU 53421 TaxID=1325120 RepID=UPI00188D8B48|nr:class IIb bacteriocin, lactobin A/cerein 7B family [Bradyrhizobium sp. CCBAU 53421]QOZ34439.1 hypothetical protein XH92_24545 [Bradyrhizobium sp. CCBAU 53421]
MNIDRELSLDQLEQASGGVGPIVMWLVGVAGGVVGNAIYDGLKSGDLQKGIDPVGMAQQYANQQKGR